jgi:protein phosphatase
MEVHISTPLGFSELGNRVNNQDSIFPDPRSATPSQRWFMVCDGVGGSHYGEVASQMAVTCLDEFFTQRTGEAPTESFIQQGIAYVEDKFNGYLTVNESATDMATTLTLLFLHGNGATVAHIGDSRVYHFRNGKIEWKTDDHSYINELVKAGVISQEEAVNHPRRNIITRAIQGGSNRVKASVQLIDDLQSGDYFLLCSDGVLEKVSDRLLEEIIGSFRSNEEKINALYNYCSGNTKDNFSAYLVPIERVVRGSAFKEAESQAFSAPVKSAANRYHGKHVRTQNRWLWILSVFFLSIAAAFGWNIYNKATSSSIPLQGRRASVADEAKTGPIPNTDPVEEGTSNAENTFTEPKPAAPPIATHETSNSTIDRAIHSMEIGKKLSMRTYLGHDASGTFGLVGKDRKSWIIQPQFESISSFENGLAEAAKNGQTIYLTEDGHVYDEKGEVNCNRIPVRKGPRYGYLNLNGQLAIGLRYSAAASFNNDCTAWVTENGKAFKIDPKGNLVAE